MFGLNLVLINLNLLFLICFKINSYILSLASREHFFFTTYVFIQISHQITVLFIGVMVILREFNR